MDFLQIFLIALGLSMDAMAVCIGLGTTAYSRNGRAKFRLAFHFGLFQFLMPVVGYFIGSFFSTIIQTWDHWIVFALLAFVGGKMVKESFSAAPEAPSHRDPSRGKNLMVLSVATSLDAMAVGLSLAFLKVDIWTPALVIGVVTGFLSLLGIYLGQGLGERFGKRMELFGGLLLVAIGFKILLEHMKK